MSRITRTEPSPSLSRGVEYHGFVFSSGVIARDPDGDLAAQTRDVLGLALAASLNAPIPEPRFGVFRM